MFKTDLLGFILCNSYFNPMVQILQHVTLFKVCTWFILCNIPTWQDSAIRTRCYLRQNHRSFYKGILTSRQNVTSFRTSVFHPTIFTLLQATRRLLCGANIVLFIITFTHTHINIYIYIFMTSIFSFPYFKFLYKHFYQYNFNNLMFYNKNMF